MECLQFFSAGDDGVGAEDLEDLLVSVMTAELVQANHPYNVVAVVTEDVVGIGMTAALMPADHPCYLQLGFQSMWSQH